MTHVATRGTGRSRSAFGVRRAESSSSDPSLPSGGGATEGEDGGGVPAENAEVPTEKLPSTVEREIWLVNEHAVDVEVYCVDFDKQYLVDEEVLAHAEGIAEGTPGAKLLCPRACRAGTLAAPPRG